MWTMWLFFRHQPQSERAHRENTQTRTSKWASTCYMQPMRRVLLHIRYESDSMWPLRTCDRWTWKVGIGWLCDSCIITTDVCRRINNLFMVSNWCTVVHHLFCQINRYYYYYKRYNLVLWPGKKCFDIFELRLVLRYELIHKNKWAKIKLARSIVWYAIHSNETKVKLCKSVSNQLVWSGSQGDLVSEYMYKQIGFDGSSDDLQGKYAYKLEMQKSEFWEN